MLVTVEIMRFVKTFDIIHPKLLASSRPLSKTQKFIGQTNYPSEVIRIEFVEPGSNNKL